MQNRALKSEAFIDLDDDYKPQNTFFGYWRENKQN